MLTIFNGRLRVFVVAVIMDLVYEGVVGRWFYPLETLIVAVVLAIVPYLVVRGPVNRIARATVKIDS